MTERDLSETLRHIKYVWRGYRPRQALWKYLRRAVAPIIEYDKAYVTMTMRDLNLCVPSTQKSDIAHAFVTKDSELDDFGLIGTNRYVVPTLKKHLSESSGRFLVLAFQDVPTHEGREILGYFVMDNKEFSYWGGRLQGLLPSRTVYTASVFVAPQSRGMGVFHCLRDAFTTHCREHDYAYDIGFAKADNLPSITATLKPATACTSSLNGIIYRIRVLNGLYERISPAQTVVDRLDPPIPEIAHLPKELQRHMNHARSKDGY